jgi:hypothetical protein
MASIPDHVHKTASKNCEPLFLSKPFLSDGHDVETANGTITFVRYQGEIFGVTCAHVFYQQMVSRKWLTLHGKNRYVYQLGVFTANGYQSNFRPLRGDGGTEGPDIALIYFGESVEQIHFPRKNKAAVDLDSWSKPNWEHIKVPVAFGYPTEHKNQAGDYLQSPLIGVAAEATRLLSEYDESFLMVSSLSEENTYYFSGMSGGPVYHVADSDSAPTLIGIVYAGVPGSSAEWQKRDTQAFLTKCDVQIRAHSLTPEIFERWLRLAKFR